MLDVDALLRPYLDSLSQEVGALELYDAHTHVGANDPDGFTQTPEQLLQALAPARARGVVFPMHEPGGYRAANEFVIEAAAASEGAMVPYCRVDPRDSAVAEATRALDAGARGIKLHPRAERFGLDVPAVRELVALAHERRVPVLIHAGRGIPALGEHTVALSGEFPDAKLILAHGAISDLAWLWKVMPEHPNLFIDTAWWNPADLMALFCLAPPAQVLWASDSPDGCRHVGRGRAALRAASRPRPGRRALDRRRPDGAAAGGRARRRRRPAADARRPAGPAPRARGHPPCDRDGRAFARTDPEEPIALARLACAVGDDQPCSAVCAAVLELLDLYEAHKHHPPTDGRPFPQAGRFVVTALAVARTPDVALP